GRTPRGQEVDDDDLPSHACERERLARERLQRESGRGPADERRGHFARIEAEPIGQQRENGNDRDGNEPAQDSAHAAFRRSGSTASTVPSVRMAPPIQIHVTSRFTWIFTVA